MRDVFGNNAPPIAATKSLTGHSLGASGVQEAIYCLLMMKNGFICESANIETLDPVFADMPIVRERRDNVDACLRVSNSFGFGGTNASSSSAAGCLTSCSLMTEPHARDFVTRDSRSRPMLMKGKRES